MKKLIFVLLIILLPTVFLPYVFSEENEHEGWNTYIDKIFKFTVDYPKNWKIEFWKDGPDIASLPSQNFGLLADYPNELLINFEVYKVEKGDSLSKFVNVSKPNKLFLTQTKKLGKADVIRTGVHWLLEDGESYELRQCLMSDGYFLAMTASLSEESIQKKDEKYKLIIEIMDTFKKL